MTASFDPISPLVTVSMLYTSYRIYRTNTSHNSYTTVQTPLSVVSDQKTTIRVAESTKERLKRHGEMGMSYDDALTRVLDRLERLERECGGEE